MDVSIIVPVYNVEKYIRPSLESMIRQTWRDIEIILIDDGSTDASGRICDEFACKDHRVKVIHKKNEGTGCARNTGMDAAEGEYLYFCDPDDILEPGLIADNLALAHQYDADIVVFGYRKIYWDGENREIKREPDCVPEVGGLYTREQFAKAFRQTFSGQYTMWTKFFRRSFLEKEGIRSTNQRIGQDVLLVLDIFTAPFQKIYYNQKVYYNYILHPKSVTTAYRLNRFECEFNAAKKKETLIRSFAVYGYDYEDMILRSYLESSNMAFGAFSIWDASPGLTFKMQKKILKDIFLKKEMKQAVKQIQYGAYQTGFGKIKLFLLKHQCYQSIILMGRIIGKKYRRF